MEPPIRGVSPARLRCASMVSSAFSPIKQYAGGLYPLQGSWYLSPYPKPISSPLFSI